jgi:site-specific recombinase XerD
MKLKTLIVQYVAFRKSMGASLETAESLLQDFCRQMGEEINATDVQPERVNIFLAGTGAITRYWHLKYGVLRGLYRYAISRGLVADSPLPTTVPKLPARFIPYIYTRTELRRLFNSTSSYRKQHRKLEPHTLRAILLLLYGAGLRVSEAVALTLDDVDLAGALITIRDTKFNKTRIVPLASELNQMMAQYAAGSKERLPSQSGSAPFFVLRRGGNVPLHLVQQTFKRLREYADVKRVDGGRYQPRLHDMRHSFAVHRLVAWYQQGADVQKLLPQLSTYLGHVDLAATQIYLTMTPELLHEASARFERYALKEESHD